MTAGVVLQPGETVYRQLPLWLRVLQKNGGWGGASFADVFVTDQRLLCRFVAGRLTSLWWNRIDGLHVDLAAEYIVLDYGDGQLVSPSGAQVAPVPSLPSPRYTAPKRWLAILPWPRYAAKVAAVPDLGLQPLVSPDPEPLIRPGLCRQTLGTKPCWIGEVRALAVAV